MHLLNRPGAAPVQQTALGQMLDDLLDAERAPLVAVQVEVIHPAHHRGFRLVDLQALLLAPPAAGDLGRNGVETERCPRAVEEALPGVLPHRPRGVLGVLLALVLVEEAEEPAGHLAHRVVAGLLRDRDDLHVVLGELALIDAELDHVPEEARQAVNDQPGEGRGLGERVGDHLLKHRALVVGGRCARFDVLAHDLMTVGGAPVAHLLELIGNREIVLGLAGRRNPRVKTNQHGAPPGVGGFPSSARRQCGYEAHSVKAKPSALRGLDRAGFSAILGRQANDGKLWRRSVLLGFDQRLHVPDDLRQDGFKQIDFSRSRRGERLSSPNNSDGRFPAHA
nr:hypothetical protein [Thauera sedimentorum]